MAAKSPNWWIKITDFGFTKRVSEQSDLQTFVGTKPYLAPEVIPHLQPDNAESSGYNKPVDIWSCGCVIFKLLVGKTPFDGNTLSTYYHQGSGFPANVLDERGVSEVCIDALRVMLAAKPKSRLKAAEALNTPWLLQTAGK